MALTAEAVDGKLASLSNTQASIGGVSAFLLFHRRRLGVAAERWAARERGTWDEHLLLLYLANDVMQLGLK